MTALRSEIARQLRGRLDLLWSLPTHLAVLLDALEGPDAPHPS